MATTASCAILVNKVRKTTAEWKTKQEIQETKDKLLNKNDNDGDEFEAATTAPATSNGDTDIPFCSLPGKSSLVELFKLAGPIFFVMMGKIACYSVLTVRATNLGVIPLATHTLMMRVFFFFACFGDSLSQAAQSFYPQVAKKLRGNLIKRLFYLSAVVGICNNQVSRLILNRFGRFLTKDSSVIQMMAEHSPLVGLSVLLHPFLMLLEGTVLAKRDLVFMVGLYIVTGLLHFGCVFSPLSSSFMGLWRALFFFQSVRLVQFGFRVWSTSRKDSKISNVAELGNTVTSSP